MRDETLILNFRHNKYIYMENSNSFTPILFDLSKFRNNEIHKKFGLKQIRIHNSNSEYDQFEYTTSNLGIKNIEEYNYLLNKFGMNQIEMKYKSLCLIFIEQLIHPFYAYQIYAIVVWIYDKYFYFSYILIICSFCDSVSKFKPHI